MLAILGMMRYLSSISYENTLIIERFLLVSDYVLNAHLCVNRTVTS